MGDQHSGQYLLRSYLELITGIATGSDTQANSQDPPLNTQGFIGEHIVDDRIWLAQTDHPLRLGPASAFHDFTCNKLLVIVRNPIDVLLAKMHHQISATLTRSVKIDSRSASKYFEEHVPVAVHEAQIFYKKVFKILKERTVPIFFVKYEELKSEPQHVLEGIFNFLLDTKDLSSSVVHQRIQEVSEK